MAYIFQLPPDCSSNEHCTGKVDTCTTGKCKCGENEKCSSGETCSLGKCIGD